MGDTLLAWTVSGTGAQVVRTTVPHDALVRNAELAGSAMELSARAEEVQPLLEALYDRVIRPVSHRLGPAGTPLVIVTEGELSALPFAALRDRERGRYMAQDHPLALRRGGITRYAIFDNSQSERLMVTPQFRASLLQGSRRIFDRAVMRSLHEGNAERALDHVEQSRISFSSLWRADDWTWRPLRARRGEVALELALVGDTLLAWTLDGTDIQLARTTLSRDAIVHDAERVRFALERHADAAEVRPLLEALYDRVLGPVSRRLGPAETPLVIVADGELSALPFAALRDRERGRYLVQEHPLRFARSLRDSAGIAAAPPVSTSVTLVADPSFDRRAFPELPPLPGAEREVAELGRIYPGAQFLAGAAATATALEAAFRRGGIAHFAGHALYDDSRPERSVLVVAARAGADRLSAGEIERMDLRRLRLVVLSACQTSRAQAGRSAGFVGLTGAFLAADAGGVVGSTWQVDDDHTRTLMVAFHRAYARSGDAGEALRRAQLELLASGDPALASPAAWAGFRYTGR